MAWLTVAEVKQHLGKDNTADDEELFGFVEAAEAMVDQLIGIVRPPTTPVVEYADGSDGVVILNRSPVAAISEVYCAGSIVAQADLDDTSPSGWYASDLDLQAGVIRHTRYFPAPPNVRVTYYPGRLVIPGNVRLATLEIVDQLWQASQRGTAGKPSYQGAEAGVVYRGFAIPQRAKELLGLPQDGGAQVLTG